MTDNLTPEAVAKMLDEAAGMLAVYQGHPDVVDQTIRLLGSSDTMTLHEVLSDMFHFISWAREAVPALAAKLAEVERDRDELRAAKWAEKHTDTMNDMVQMGMARDEAMARAEAAETEVARLREALDNLLDAITALDEIGDRTLTITGSTANLKWLLEAEEDARAALAAWEAGNG
jgi:uncharacterized membrane protein